MSVSGINAECTSVEGQCKATRVEQAPLCQATKIGTCTAEQMVMSLADVQREYQVLKVCKTAPSKWPLSQFFVIALVFLSNYTYFDSIKAAFVFKGQGPG